MQSANSYCKLNYGLPTELTHTDADVSGTPELGKNSPFRVLYNVIEGHLGSVQPGVTYVTHLTKDFVNYLAEVVRYWEGPVSLAVYVKDDDPSFILERILHFCYCIPDMSRVSLHLVFRKDLRPHFYLSKQMPPQTCEIQKDDKLITPAITANNNNKSDTSDKNKALDNWYPINVCRNAARKAAYTNFVLVCDIELMPSQGLASRFIDMTESYKCVGPDCQKRIYVVPVFEVDSSEDIPANKSQLVHLMNENKAVYFHQLTCVHCQKFPGLDEWKETDPGNIIKPLLETKREQPYHRWEPIYIGTKNEPMYFEKLSWEGFQDKMLQMLEMCLAGYKLVILDGAFLVHWPGIKRAKRTDESWRTPYVNINQGYYDNLFQNISKKYPENPKCNDIKP